MRGICAWLRSNVVGRRVQKSTRIIPGVLFGLVLGVLVMNIAGEAYVSTNIRKPRRAMPTGLHLPHLPHEEGNSNAQLQRHDHEANTAAAPTKKLRNGTKIATGLISKKVTCSAEHDEIPSGEATERARLLFCLAKRSAARATLLKTKKLRGGEIPKSREDDDSKTKVRNSSHGSPVDSSGTESAGAAATETQSSFVTASSSRIDEWVMTLELGTPGRAFNAIVDTGSDLTWVQCDPCIQCYDQPDPHFNPAGSSSFSFLSCFSPMCANLPLYACDGSDYLCEYLYLYGDGSATLGYLASETLTLTRTSGEKDEVGSFVFGCGEENSQSFEYLQADGLVGLGQGPLSLSSQLGSVIGGKFSYCLVSRGDAANVTSPLFFGDAAILEGDNVVYTPIVINQAYPTYYYVKLLGISVDGDRVHFSNDTLALDSNGDGGLIMDSGTTITQLQWTAYAALEAAFINKITYPSATSASGLSLCYDTSGISGVPDFPSLTFHFDAAADVLLPQENYFVAVDTDTTFCLIIMSTDSVSVYGNWQQQNFQILYDTDNARIGFKPITCDELH